MSNSNDSEGYLKYLQYGQSVFFVHWIVKKGTKPNLSILLSIKEKSEWLIKNIEKYPTAAGTIGLGISIYLLYDSWADYTTQNMVKEYDDLLKTPISDFATSEAYHKYMIKQTNRLRRHVLELKSRKLERVVIKGIFGVVFGWIAWVTNAAVLRPLAWIASALGLMAAGADVSAWYQLHNLAKAFEKTGYIV